jgi:hypothetical protein
MNRISKFELLKKQYNNKGLIPTLQKIVSFSLKRSVINNFLLFFIRFFYLDGLLRFAICISSVPIKLDIPVRNIIIQKYLNKFSTTYIKCLEIGTWCAEGSTKTIASAIASKGELFCIDQYEPWASIADKKVSSVYSRFDNNARIAGIMAFLNCRKFSKMYKIPIYLIIGTSKIPLQTKFFHFIYIDGDHKYQAFSQDVNRALELIRDDGFIIVDDFEVTMPFKKGLIEECSKNIDLDLIFSEIENNFIHPGIVLGISELLTNNKNHINVKSENGCCVISREILM